MNIITLLCCCEDSLKVGVENKVDVSEAERLKSVGEKCSKQIFVHVRLRSLGSSILPVVTPGVEYRVNLSVDFILNKRNLEAVHCPAGSQQSVDLIDDVQGVEGRHFMENIGIVDQVE